MRRVVRTVDDDVVDRVDADAVVERSVAHAPWSPAQIVTFIVGFVLAVLGGVALARTGINFADLDAARAEVMGLEHTPVLALCELVLGLVLLGAAAAAGAPRGTMSFVGVVLLLFGVIVAIEPGAFNRSLGTTSGHGWFYAIVGALLLVAAMVSPVVFSSAERRYVHRDHVFGR